MATVNTYHFNVFQLLEAGQGKGMRFLLGELLSTYGLIGNAIIQGEMDPFKPFNKLRFYMLIF